MSKLYTITLRVGTYMYTYMMYISTGPGHFLTVPLNSTMVEECVIKGG